MQTQKKIKKSKNNQTSRAAQYKAIAVPDVACHKVITVKSKTISWLRVRSRKKERIPKQH